MTTCIRLRSTRRSIRTAARQCATRRPMVWKVYQAIRSSKSVSGNNWQNTLLIITFDEHGGGYDHVPPPCVTPPDANGFKPGRTRGFRFQTARGSCADGNGVSKYCGEHDREHSNAPLLLLADDATEVGPDLSRASSGHRPTIYEVFTSTARDLDTWPDWKVYPGPSSTLDEAQMLQVDPGNVPLNDLQKSIIEAIVSFTCMIPC